MMILVFHRWIAEYLVSNTSSREDGKRMLPLNIRSHTSDSVSIVLNPVSYWDGWDMDMWMPGFYRELGRDGFSSSAGVVLEHCIADSRASVALIDCADASIGTEWWDGRALPGFSWELHDVDASTEYD